MASDKTILHWVSATNASGLIARLASTGAHSIQDKDLLAAIKGNYDVPDDVMTRVRILWSVLHEGMTSRDARLCLTTYLDRLTIRDNNRFKAALEEFKAAYLRDEVV